MSRRYGRHASFGRTTDKLRRLAALACRSTDGGQLGWIEVVPKCDSQNPLGDVRRWTSNGRGTIRHSKLLYVPFANAHYRLKLIASQTAGPFRGPVMRAGSDGDRRSTNRTICSFA